MLEDTWLELSRDDIDDVIRRFQMEKTEEYATKNSLICVVVMELLPIQQ